jgi:hypothetical protein
LSLSVVHILSSMHPVHTSHVSWESILTYGPTYTYVLQTFHLLHVILRNPIWSCHIYIMCTIYPNPSFLLETILRYIVSTNIPNIVWQPINFYIMWPLHREANIN